MSYHYYEPESLRRLTEKIFKSYGYSESDAAVITDVMIQADLFGIESHGVQRLKLYTSGIDIGRIRVDAVPEIIKETPVSAVIDAHSCSGQLASMFASETAAKKAKKSGIGMTVVRNSNHYGIAGYYSLWLSRRNLIGLSLTNTWALVLPTYGTKPMMGTNPIAFTVPASPYPFHLDMATSVVTCGKMEVYKKAGKETPRVWALNEDGTVNTDPVRFVENNGKAVGGLLPLGGMGEIYGGHKGYGLSVMVEILTGILAGGLTSDRVTNNTDKGLTSHMIMAIDPALFSEEPQNIFRNLSMYLQDIRNSSRVKDEQKIYIHGEKEFQNEEKVRKQGIAVSDSTLEEIREICKKLGIKENDYLTENIF